MASRTQKKQLDYFPSESNMRNKKEKQILTAIKKNDVETLKKILINPAWFRLGHRDIAVLSVAILYGARDVIKFLIDSGRDVEEVDQNGNTALHFIATTSHVLVGDDLTTSLVDILDILLSGYSNVVEAVFVKRNKAGMTPFLLACDQGRNAFIMRFLALADNNRIPASVDDYIGYKGNNIFHLLFGNLDRIMPPMIVETVQGMVDKIKCSDLLVDAKNDRGEPPLCRLLPFDRYLLRSEGGKGFGELMRLFFNAGASPDFVHESGLSYLLLVISLEEWSALEVLLRAGCRCANVPRSPLAYVLRNQPKQQSIRMIELLLAFGYDLQKDLFLYTVDERPIEFTSFKHAVQCNISAMDPDILESLRELRRSNTMLSLQRQCRNTIRRHLEGKADEVIGKLTCIPDRIKSYLLVQNERQLLESSGQ